MSEGPEIGVHVERGAATAVLRNRSFRNLVYAAATSSIGDWIGLFALIALAATLGGANRIGALAVSFVMIARIVPTLFLAPLAGVFVDRWDRRRTMIVTDIVRGAVMLAVAFVGNVFQLVIATFVIEIAAALFIPAKDATVPTIVRRDQLVQANQLSLLSTYATLPIGALLAAVVISLTERVAGVSSLVARFPDATTFLAERPEAVPIILNALSFFLSIIFIQRMDVPDENVHAYEQRAETTTALTELRDGLAFIAGMPLIRALIVGITTAFLAAGAVMGAGEFFAIILNASDSGFATLGFVVGTGLVAGIAGAGPLSKRIAKERLFAPGVFLAGISLVAAALMPTLLLAALPAALMGVGAGVAFILGYTMLQEYSADVVRGRIFATFNTAVRLALFAALVLGPLSIAVLGVERTQAEIDRGVQPDLEDIEDFGQAGRYPYQIGGVRLTLIMAGLTAAGGAVWTGSSIARVLRRREEQGALDDVATDTGAAGGDGPGPDPERGGFVVFEGGEGAGKSTQVRLLHEVLEERGHEVVVTREPGGTPTGEAVREVLLDATGEVAPRTEALLYAAARAQHAADVLGPAVERGAVVLCDRYIDSSIAYQGVGRDLGEKVVADLNSWATDGLEPDLTVLLDVPSDVGLARAGEVDEPDRLEAAGSDFHERVNEAYRQRARLAPGRYLVLDARQPVEELHELILRRVESLLPAAPMTDDDAATEPDADVPSEPDALDAPDGSAAPPEPPEPPGEDDPMFRQPLFEEVEFDTPDAATSPSDAAPAAPAPTTSSDAAGPNGDDRREVPAWLALPDEEHP